MAFCILQKDRFWVFEAVLSFCRLPVSWICQLPPQFHPAKSSSSFLSCCSVLLHPFLPWPVMNCAGEEGGSERKSEGSGNIHPERSLLNKKNLWAVVLCQTPLMVISARLSLCGWLVGLWFGYNQIITGCKMGLLKKKIIVYKCLVLVTRICCHPVLELRALLFSLGTRMWQAMVPKRLRAKHTLTTRC